MKRKEQGWNQRKQKKTRGIWSGENSNVFSEKLSPQTRILPAKAIWFPGRRGKWDSYLADTK